MPLTVSASGRRCGSMACALPGVARRRRATVVSVRSLMTAPLSGKTLFISGASRGIGLAIALRAARDGANVALIAKTAEPHPKLEGTIYTAAEQIEARSEEHTSELQSRQYLVCRLLLEKKK